MFTSQMSSISACTLLGRVEFATSSSSGSGSSAPPPPAASFQLDERVLSRSRHEGCRPVGEDVVPVVGESLLHEFQRGIHEQWGGACRRAHAAPSEPCCVAGRFGPLHQLQSMSSA
eukprot:1897123-Rhodomonas_salina.6